MYLAINAMQGMDRYRKEVIKMIKKYFEPGEVRNLLITVNYLKLYYGADCSRSIILTIGFKCDRGIIGSYFCQICVTSFINHPQGY